MLQLKFIAGLCQRAPELNLPKSDILRTSILGRKSRSATRQRKTSAASRV